MDVQERAGRPLNEAAVRAIVRGLVSGNLVGEDVRWTAEDPFWGGTRTTVMLVASPTLDRTWRLIAIGDDTMQLVEEFKGTASYADLNMPWLDSFGPNRKDLAVVVVAHALIDAVAELS